MNHEQSILEFYLEDYASPRYLPAAKAYYGTRESFHKLVRKLASNLSANRAFAELGTRYAAFVGGAGATNQVAGKEYPMLTPVQVIGRKHYYLEEHGWNYTAVSMHHYPMFAESVVVDQLLLMKGDQIIRCIKPQFQNLMIRSRDAGWCKPEMEFRGFPFLYHEDEKEGMLAANFYTAVQLYRKDQVTQAMRDLDSEEKLNLSCACNDLFGMTM